MNVFKQELKMAYRSVIYWTFAMIGICWLFMTFYQSIAADAALMNEVFENFPKEFLNALGISDLDMSTIQGYYGLIFNYVTLIGAIYAMKLGLSVLSEEARCKTSDFLVVKPVERYTIVTAKLMTVLVLVVVQNIVYDLVSYGIALIYKEIQFDTGLFFMVNSTLFFVQMFFIGFGLLLSVLIKRIKSVLPITMGVVFAFFVLQMLNETLNEESLTYVTPFAYFNMSSMIKDKAIDGTYLILDAVLIVLFITLTYVIYKRKDMPSV